MELMSAENDVFAIHVGTLQQGGMLLGNLTATQSILRKLTPGETRENVCAKACKSFNLPRKPFLKCDAKLDMMIQKLSQCS